MSNSLRTFIALEISNEYKNILKNIQTSLKTVDADVKWVEPENYHITLKFLGSTRSDQIEPITNIIDGLANNTAAFFLELGALGAFPMIERPNIIWAGLTRGNEQLSELSNILEEQSSKIGFPNEKREFYPHITIGRTRCLQNAQALSDALKTTTVISTVQKAQHITLFESVLSSDGPKYSVIHRASLNT